MNCNTTHYRANSSSVPGDPTLVASLRAGESGDALEVRVEPLALPLDDPLARVDGVRNALTIETDTVRTVTVIGPGAGLELAGQGVFADLVAVARARR